MFFYWGKKIVDEVSLSIFILLSTGGKKIMLLLFCSSHVPCLPLKNKDKIVLPPSFTYLLSRIIYQESS